MPDDLDRALSVNPDYPPGFDRDMLEDRALEDELPWDEPDD